MLLVADVEQVVLSAAPHKPVEALDEHEVVVDVCSDVGSELTPNQFKASLCDLVTCEVHPSAVCNVYKAEDGDRAAIRRTAEAIFNVNAVQTFSFH